MENKVLVRNLSAGSNFIYGSKLARIDYIEDIKGRSEEILLIVAYTFGSGWEMVKMKENESVVIPEIFIYHFKVISFDKRDDGFVIMLKTVVINKLVYQVS